MDKKGVSRFSVEVFLSQVAEDIVGEPFCVSEMFWYQKFLDKRGITILPNFLSHIAKNHRGRTVLCFRIILVSKSFG